MEIAEWIARNFETIQKGILILGLLSALWFLRIRQNPSQFRAREADRSDLDRFLNSSPESGRSSRAPGPRKNRPPPPLLLPGIRLTGEPHEILGIPENSTELEILRAYKEAIKRFHPDTIQGSAREQMRFYEEASARINDAKETMIRRLRNQGGRSY